MKRLTVIILISVIYVIIAIEMAMTATEVSSEKLPETQLRKSEVTGATTVAPVRSTDVPVIKLNTGYSMPILGLGTWTLDNKTAEEAVYFAIQNGYRLIDTARYYGNEVGVGRAVRRAIDNNVVKREALFITSKILPTRNVKDTEAEVDASLAALGLDYLDLMLIHQPGFNDQETYKALERRVKAGRLRSIGISNYYTPEEFERINRIAEITPAVVQNENHIYYQNNALQEYVKQYGVVVESWYPFGGRPNIKEVLENETIKEIADSHRKTTAQVILRWQIQAGYVVIPGSRNPEHIKENISIFDFELTDDEMKEIGKLNKGRRFENW